MLKVKTKVTAEDEAGNWVEFQGARLKIAFKGSRYKQALDEAKRPYQKDIAKGKASIVDTENMFTVALSKTILLDWSGLADSEGNEVLYSQKMAASVLLNNPDVFEFVNEYSEDPENFLGESAEEIAKKSQTS